MENFIDGVMVVLLAGVMILFAAFIGGTVLWLIWPVAIPAAFPGLVEAGTLADKMSWFQSVCLVWIFGLLIKASQKNENKK